jgi:predicted nucleotidyltransferase
VSVELRRPRIDIDEAAVGAFCQRWRVQQLALFGSVMRPDFSDQSDIDVMVTFLPDSGRLLWDLVDMQDELGALFGRTVHIATPEIMVNPYRRRSIKKDLRVIYAA